MKKLILLILLVIGMMASNAANRTGYIKTGLTMLSPTMAFSTSDSIVTSATYTITITNPQKYLQHQTFTTTLANVDGGSPSVAITAYGKVTSGGSWVQIGSPVTLTDAGTATITSTTPLNYNYLKVAYVASGATQHMKVTAFEVKTANVYDITSAGLVALTSGATINGGTVNVNASSNNATNIGTGTTTSAVTVGGGSNTVAVNSSAWKVTTAGAVSGVTTITASGTVTAGTLVRKSTPTVVNATATLSAANMMAGTISCTSTSAVTMTTPTATAIAALIPGCGAGTSFELTIDNSASTSSGIVTVALDASVTQPPTEIITGQKTLTLAVGTVGRFYFYFTSATAAKIYRVF